jgi:hypothetical protein
MSTNFRKSLLGIAAGAVLGSVVVAASPESLFRNGDFSRIEATGLPSDWNFSPAFSSGKTPVDTRSYAVPAVFDRPVLRTESAALNWDYFGQTVNGVQGGSNYVFSLTHREAQGFNHTLVVSITQYSKGKKINDDYLDTSIPASMRWTVWSKEFTPEPGVDALGVFVYPRGKGIALFSGISLALKQAGTAPAQALPAQEETGVTLSPADLLQWKKTNVRADLQSGTCALAADGADFGLIGPAEIPLDMVRYPFLSLQVSQDTHAGGLCVALNGNPLGIVPVTDTDGVFSCDLRVVPGLAGKKTASLALYVVGKDKQLFVDWIRTANKPLAPTLEIAKDKKYLLFVKPVFSVNSYDTLPTRDEIGKPVVVALCPNQFESASFCLYTQKTLNQVTMEVSDLKNKQGAVLPAAMIGMRTVKVWYQGGSATSIEHGPKNLVPELLLKNDALIPVDRDRQENVLKFEGLPQDSAVLQPLDIPPGTTKEFWITVSPPGPAAPGLYEGKITVRALHEKPETLPVQITILPFELSGPGRVCGMYGGFYAEPVLKNLADHGIDSLLIDPAALIKATRTNDTFAYDFSALAKALDTLHACRLDKPVILNPSWFEPLYNIYSPASTFAAAQKGMKKWQTECLGDFAAQLKRFLTGNKYENIYIYGVDEPSFSQWAQKNSLLEVTRFYRCKEIFAVLQAAGLKTTTAIMDTETLDALGPLLDLPIYAVGVIDQIMTENLQGKWRAGLYYPHPNESPAYNRAVFGLFCWYSRMLGFASWIYMGDDSAKAYNDFADFWGNRYPGYVYPAKDGVIDTIEWEAFRAAINDLRYLNTLQACVEHGKNITGAETLRLESMDLLGKTPGFIRGKDIEEIAGTVRPEQFQAFRQAVIDKILAWKRLEGMKRGHP